MQVQLAEAGIATIIKTTSHYETIFKKGVSVCAYMNCHVIDNITCFAVCTNFQTHFVLNYMVPFI